MGALIFLGAGVWFLGIAALVIFTIIFWVRMIIDCANREFKNPNDKIIWVLIVVLLQILGAIIYWSVIKKSDSSSISK